MGHCTGRLVTCDSTAFVTKFFTDKIILPYTFSTEIVVETNGELDINGDSKVLQNQ